jgi:hypothetical protein
VKGERWLGRRCVFLTIYKFKLGCTKTLAKRPSEPARGELSESLFSPSARPFTFHLSRCLPHLPCPAIRQKAVHEQLERMIKHDWQENQTEVGTGAENQDRQRYPHR